MIRPRAIGPTQRVLLFSLIILAACRGAGDRVHLASDHFEVPIVVRPAEGTTGKLPEAILPDDEGQLVRALVDLRDQVDLHALGETLTARKASRLERRRIVITALEKVAREAQAELRPVLEELRQRGAVRSYSGYSVANRMLVEATPEGLRTLAELPQVATIVRETETAEEVWAGDPPAAVARSRTSWAIASLGAGAGWRQGLDGSGVVVGIIDSGASAVHEQLHAGFRAGERGWLDPAGGRTEPRDGAYGHGTGVLSCAVGRNVNGITLGVAPEAEWAACAGLPEGRFNNVLMTECADWMLNIARPDVLINAWLLPEPGCDPSLKPIVDAWRAAEILPLFAAGNTGSGPGADRSPANYTGLYPGSSAAFSVGGLTGAGELFARSATGPNSCDGEATFPTVVAPAEDVIVALPLTASTYRQAEGTSQAVGFAAGAAALLLQRHPEASVVELETALREGAVDLGPPGPDPRFGYGRLDLPGAMAALDRIRGHSATARLSRP